MKKFSLLTSMLFIAAFIVAPAALRADTASYDYNKKVCQEKMKNYPGQYEWESKTGDCKKVY